MIYASASIVINTSSSQLWNILEEFVKAPVQGSYIKDCLVVEDHYDAIVRSLSISGETAVKERVFFLKDQNKIVARLEDHPTCIGDTIYQIIASDQEELSNRRVTLCAVFAWRMRPGIIEAPAVNRQVLIDDLLASIAAAGVRVF